MLEGPNQNLSIGDFSFLLERKAPPLPKGVFVSVIEDVERAVDSKIAHLSFRVIAFFATVILIPSLFYSVSSIVSAVDTLKAQQADLSAQLQVIRHQSELDKAYMTADRDALKAQVRSLTDVVSTLSAGNQTSAHSLHIAADYVRTATDSLQQQIKDMQAAQLASQEALREQMASDISRVTQEAAHDVARQLRAYNRPAVRKPPLARKGVKLKESRGGRRRRAA